MEAEQWTKEFKQTAYGKSWPMGNQMSENMKEYESMSRFMKWVEDEALIKGLNPLDLLAFCCIGTGIDFRDEAEARYVSVWAPQLSDKVQKVWCVHALESFMSSEPDAIPFFFSIRESTTR
jgi:hypothetical protein